MGLLKGLFDLADEIISIPTDILGITGNSSNEDILRKAKVAFLNGDITAREYETIKRLT